MLAQDFKPRMDITGLTIVSGTEIQQITSTAKPADDKGIVIVTTDLTDGVADVPDPAKVVEGITPDYWIRYVWIRKPHHSATTVKRNVVYTWNPLRASHVKLLRWEPIDELISNAINNSDEALRKANEALSKANQAIATSELTKAEMEEIRKDLTDLEEKYNEVKAVNDGLVVREPGVGVDNGSTDVLYKFKVSPVQTDLRDGQVVRFICPITCGFEPKFQMMDYGKDAVPEVPAIPASGGNPAVPAVPAQPAVPPKDIGVATYLSRVGSMGNQMRVYTGDMVKGQYIEVTYNKTLNLWCLTLPVTIDGIASPFDLTVRTNPSAPLTSISIRAHALTLTNNLSVGARIKHSADLTCDITAANGSGGLDQGGKTASTWYYIWVIFNPDTKAFGSLLSLSGNNPKMPTGFTHKCMVGQVFNDATSNFREFYQKDNTVWFAPVNIFDNKTGGTNYAGLEPIVEQKTLNELVPLNAISVGGNVGKMNGTELCMIYLAGNANGVGEVIVSGTANNVAANGWMVVQSFKDVPLITPLIDPTQPLVSQHNLYWKTGINPNFHRLQISSYKFHSIYIWN